MNIFKILKKKWYILIGILIFAYILYCRINIREVAKILTEANFFLIVFAIFLMVAMTISYSYRWNYLKRIQNIKYSIKDSFLMYNAAFLFSTVTPGHIGDLIKIIYLKKDGYSLGKSLVSVVLDRFADISFLLIIGYISMCFLARFFLKHIIILTALISAIVFLIFVFKKRRLPKIIIKRIIKFVVPNKYQKSWHLNYQDFINDLKTYRLKNYLTLYIITMGSWLINYTAIFLLAKSININISFISLVMSITIAILTTLIPISILGLGTRDAALIFLFSLFAISPEKAVSFSTLYLLALLTMAFVGLICWLKKPFKDIPTHKNAEKISFIL